MSDGNWTLNHTFKDRYLVTGIIDLILEHTKDSNKKLVIIDVGCSEGIAMKFAQDYLKQKHVESFTVGIDVSKNILKKANENLNEFINKDVLKVDNYAEKADIVICSKMAIFVTGEVRSKIIKKCSKFLKNDGILITDVDCYEKSQLIEELNLVQYMLPTLSCFKKGWNEYRMRFYTPLRKKIKKKCKDDALNYAEEILSGWQNLSFLQKLDWKLTIHGRLVMNAK